MIELSKADKILVTGGSGFIGGTLIRKLLKETQCTIFILDKVGYASDIIGINKLLNDINYSNRLFFLKVDLTNFSNLKDAIKSSDPDFVFHLAAESHVDRSIDSPYDFINNNIIGTYNLLEIVKIHWLKLNRERMQKFRFLHISTDEVFGSLNNKDQKFNENTSYDPRSPYSASKASSDHLVRAWFHTYGLPVIITNCSNNFGPRQFPEKLIPLVIQKALERKEIPLYGDGSNIRNWLFVEDHADALFLVICRGNIGETYCIGGNEEYSNLEVVNLICEIIQELKPRKNSSYKELIKKVKDRPGHDFRYSINSSKIFSELGWRPNYDFNRSLRITINWYIKNLDWCNSMLLKSGYLGNRLGIMKDKFS